jgi:hypothetical protein
MTQGRVIPRSGFAVKHGSGGVDVDGFVPIESFGISQAEQVNGRRDKKEAKGGPASRVGAEEVVFKVSHQKDL